MSASLKFKEEGNKLFMKRNYKEAIEMYTKALEKSETSLYHTNRALCYFKLNQWQSTMEDCRRAIELDCRSVKGHFYLGQALCETGFYDEALVQLKRAHELTRELSENYGDEITRVIRNVRKRRWQSMEEKRIQQEIELQTYLQRLMLDDKSSQLKQLETSGDAEGSVKRDKEVAASEIEANFEQRFAELNRLFAENDARRRKREIPDYLCGKISFEIMTDPVVTPYGITYDRRDIEQHLHRVGRFDPVTRQELNIDQLIPNLAMKEVIENFVEQNEWIDGEL